MSGNLVGELILWLIVAIVATMSQRINSPTILLNLLLPRSLVVVITMLRPVPGPPSTPSLPRRRRSGGAGRSQI